MKLTAKKVLSLKPKDKTYLISENTLTNKIQQLGLKASSHGIRSTGSTLL